MKTAPEQNQCVTIAETQRNTAAPLFCFLVSVLHRIVLCDRVPRWRWGPWMRISTMDSCWHLGDDMRAQSQKGAAGKKVKHSSGSGQRAGSPGRWGRQLCLIPLNGWAGKKKGGGKGDLSVRWKIASGEKEGGWWSFKKKSVSQRWPTQRDALLFFLFLSQFQFSLRSLWCVY